MSPRAWRAAGGHERARWRNAAGIEADTGRDGCVGAWFGAERETHNITKRPVVVQRAPLGLCGHRRGVGRGHSAPAAPARFTPGARGHGAPRGESSGAPRSRGYAPRPPAPSARAPRHRTLEGTLLDGAHALGLGPARQSAAWARSTRRLAHPRGAGRPLAAGCWRSASVWGGEGVARRRHRCAGWGRPTPICPARWSSRLRPAPLPAAGARPPSRPAR
jgi:hypothetical protein